MKKAVELKVFKGLKVGRDKIVINHLQFADDTVLLSKATGENVKCSKLPLD